MTETAPDLREVAADVMRRSEAIALDELEVVVSRSRFIEVCIEKNEIHTTRAQEEPEVGVRVVHRKSLGFASSNSFAPLSLAETLEQASALARACPEDEYNGLPDPAPLTPVDELFDPELESLGPEEALHHARRMLDAARRVDPRVRVDAGSFVVEVLERAVRSTRGVLTFERESRAMASLMALAVDGTNVSGMDYWTDGARRLSGLDVEVLGRRVAERVVANLGARPGHSFQGTVVFTPRVVGQLLVNPLLYAASADNVQRGFSRLAGEIDRGVASSDLCLEDDGTRPGEVASSGFDREGMPRRVLPLLAEGRLVSYLHNAYTARRAGTRTTGHAAGGARSLPGVGPTNVVVNEGASDLDDLIRGVKRGVLVTRFSGHPRLTSGDFSGAIKGGFLIENGRVGHPIKETMISGNTFDLLRRIVAMSRERERCVTLTAPSVLVDGVSVSGRS